jgi:hypothetical protein
VRRVHVVAPDAITGKAVASLLDGRFALACTPPADVALVVDDVFLPSTMRTILHELITRFRTQAVTFATRAGVL